MDLNHGTLMNGATFAAGKVGQAAFSFDGVNDYVTTPGTDCNFGTGDFTLMAWIKYEGPTDQSVGYPAIMSKRPPGTNPIGGFGFYLSYWSGGTFGSLMLRIYDMNYVPCLTPVDDGNWYHVAVTREGTTINFYVDGDPDGTANSNKDANSNADLRLGLDDSSSIRTEWKGSLDEVAVYNRALSGAEILCVYNASLAGNDYCCGQMKIIINKAVWEGVTATIENTGCIKLLNTQWQITWKYYGTQGMDDGGGNSFVSLSPGASQDVNAWIADSLRTGFGIIIAEATVDCCDTTAWGIGIIYGGNLHMLFASP